MTIGAMFDHHNCNTAYSTKHAMGREMMDRFCLVDSTALEEAKYTLGRREYAPSSQSMGSSFEATCHDHIHFESEPPL